jgi:predicted DNA-binding transcriptional regulator
MTQAKLRAYADQIITGNAKNTGANIYNLIKASERGVSLKGICKGLGLKHQSASARISDLLDAGLIYVYITDLDNNISYFRAVKSKSEQVQLQNIRHAEKVEQWKARGKKLGINFVITD